MSKANKDGYDYKILDKDQADLFKFKHNLFMEKLNDLVKEFGYGIDQEILFDMVIIRLPKCDGEEVDYKFLNYTSYQHYAEEELVEKIEDDDTPEFWKYNHGDS